MSTKRVQRYRGFYFEVTYLAKYPDVEIYAERTEYPALAFSETDVKRARERIEEYWKSLEGSRRRK